MMGGIRRAIALASPPTPTPPQKKYKGNQAEWKSEYLHLKTEETLAFNLKQYRVGKGWEPSGISLKASANHLFMVLSKGNFWALFSLPVNCKM